MARYKKRKDGLYQANIFVGIDSLSGCRKYKSVYARTLNELELKKADIKVSIHKGIYADDKKMTLGQWAEFCFELEHGTDGVRTKEMYERIIFRKIIPALGHIRLRDLKKSDIQLLINDNWEHPRSCTQILMCIRQLLNAAMDEGLIHKSVCLRIKKPQYNRPKQRTLTKAEKYAFLHAAFTFKEQVFVSLLFYLGLRKGEALALRKSKIDCANRTIIIDKAVSFDSNTPFLKDTKTENGHRQLAIPQPLNELLKAYLPTVKDFLFEMQRPNKKLVDINQQKLMSKTSYNKFWKGILAKMDASVDDGQTIDNLTSRVFRYNYATMLYYSGVDIKEAQYRMGHADVHLTLDIYTALDPGQSDANEKYEAYLNNVIAGAPDKTRFHLA